MKLSEEMKNEILSGLLPLKPQKIILFGSYAWGEPTEDSDIDIFLLKDISKEETINYSLQARKNLRTFIAKNKIGIDIFADSEERFKKRIDEYGDYFCRDIIENGVFIYE